ncbi:putative serine/threonine-protein kinase/receptor [Histomonas meleagridis]|uniref:putative serine/threonine-protein kinase/receptor n=1 Tax=Histomonas meleagridis TaxID=135588 RepID=UPI0035595736|nr:putative serine/threonine-protein kinase/receptor [Histomonas meleagridis]KAH0797905.1 putative serine/threonine-protein kinase/receptor [Histomonas meleagridis]
MLVSERNEQEFTKEEQRRFIDSLDLFVILDKNIHKGEFCIDKGIIKYTGQIVAMKRALTGDSYKSLVNEFKTLCKLSHPAVQSLVGFYPNPDYKKAVLITPFYINGTLRNIINSPPSELNLLTKTIIIFGIATGLNYLHEKGIIHHDLKVDNILIDDNFHPIITGFGDSHKNPKGELMFTLPYIAPEVLSGGQYTPKTDVYSFGLLVNEIFSGSPPYKGLSDQQINENIMDGNPPQIASEMPDLFKKILMKCINKDPSKRPKSKDIFKKIKNGLDDLKVNRSVLDTYKNQLLDSALCPLNNFIIPTPLIELPGKPHPWNEKGTYPILLDVFESVLKKAGDRPIVLVMLFGPYQSGKSTFLRTLTGNAAFYAGKGIKSQTQGILIDGPYIVSDLINRLDDDYRQLKENVIHLILIRIRQFFSLIHKVLAMKIMNLILNQYWIKLMQYLHQ